MTVVVGATWCAVALTQPSAGHSGHQTTAISASVTPAFIWGWTLMSIAMMLPVTLAAVRHVGLNSIRRRRQWAMALYSASYLAVWIVFGIVALGLVAAIRAAGITDRNLLMGVLAVATAWQLSRTKRRALLSCRRTVPLPPDGLRADFGCFWFGVLQAWRCVLACWPLMLLMALVGHHLALMVAATIVVMVEERASQRERLIAPIAGVFAVVTLVVALRP